MTPAAQMNMSSAASNYPPEEWQITRQLVRMIGNAPTWQNIVEASDALFHVQLMAKSLRSERDHHAAASQRTEAQEWTCLGGHTWVGLPDSCCPECDRRPSAHALKPVS